MRRLSVIATSAFILVMAAPRPALAWWDIIEELSGPGKFYGWDIDVRLFCLVDSISKEKVSVQTKDGKTKTVDQTTNVDTKFIPIPPIGAILSTCSPEDQQPDPKDKDNKNKRLLTKRRAAFDIGARFMWADHNPDFAHEQRISLTTLEPAVTIALLSRFEKADVVDYGFGAGLYWFSSTDFPSFHGTFLEPVRVEGHAPFVWRKHAWSAAIPRARFGVLVFPAGFERAAFAATNPVPTRISRDWARTFSLMWDLEPLLKHLQP